MAIFNAFWYGPSLNAFHFACMRSFLRLGHEYRLFAYEPLEVPQGVTLLDASSLILRKDVFFFRNRFTGSSDDVGPFSDLFRYKLLLELGGWYVDMDTFCLSAEIPSGIRAWAQENEQIEGKIIINGAQMSLPQGDHLALELYKRCVAIGSSSANREDWGPNLLTRVIMGLGLRPNVFGTTETFYPIDWIGSFTLISPQYRDYVTTKTASAIFLAAYQSFFRYSGIDLGRTPPAGSYLRDLYEALAPDRMTGVAYSYDEIKSLVRSFFIRNGDWAIPQLTRSVGPDVLGHLDL